MKMSISIEINAPKKKVWEVITNIENSQNVLSSITDLNILHKPEDSLIGLKWNETRKIFGKESTETMWIIEAQEEAYYITHAQNRGTLYATKMALSEQNGSTTLSMSFSGTTDSKITKVVSAVMGIFIKKSMIKMIRKDLEEIKIYVENK